MRRVLGICAAALLVGCSPAPEASERAPAPPASEKAPPEAEDAPEPAPAAPEPAPEGPEFRTGLTEADLAVSVYERREFE